MRPGQEHEAEPLADLGRELEPAAVHGAHPPHPPGRLDHHRGEPPLAKRRLRHPERRRLAIRAGHHQAVRVQAESGEPRGMKGRKGTTFDDAPQDRPAKAGAQYRRESGGPRPGHRMHPPPGQAAAEPAVDLPSVHARPRQLPPPFERPDPGAQLLPHALHVEIAAARAAPLVLSKFSLWSFLRPMSIGCPPPGQERNRGNARQRVRRKNFAAFGPLAMKVDEPAIPRPRAQSDRGR